MRKTIEELSTNYQFKTKVNMKNRTSILVGTRHFFYALLGAVYRLLWLVVAPIFMIYMMFPPLWIIGIPYWIITDRDLMKDWCKMYGI